MNRDSQKPTNQKLTNAELQEDLDELESNLTRQQKRKLKRRIAKVLNKKQ